MLVHAYPMHFDPISIRLTREDTRDDHSRIFEKWHTKWRRSFGTGLTFLESVDGLCKTVGADGNVISGKNHDLLRTTGTAGPHG